MRNYTPAKLGVLVVALYFSSEPLALASGRPPLSGRWTASAMTQRWNIGEWGEKCGPKPHITGAPSGSVTISQIGNELSFAGAGPSYSTTRCWDQSNGLRRVSHSSAPRGWSNRCTTPANDPRHAIVTTTIVATDTSIHFDEIGKYSFALGGAVCTATVRLNRSFRLVQRAGSTPAASASAAEAPDSASDAGSASNAKPTSAKPVATSHTTTPHRCEDKGAPARLEIRPSRKLIRPGEKFRFRSIVLDANGCYLSKPPTWQIVEGKDKLTVSSSGEVVVSKDASEGTALLRASVAGKHVQVSVEVASQEHYDAILKARGMNAKGEVDTAAVVSIASGKLAAKGAVAEDTTRGRKIIFSVVVGLFALLAAAIALIVVKRGHSKDQKRARLEEEQAQRDLDAAHAKALAARKAAGRRNRREVVEATLSGSTVIPPPEMVCPVCHQHYPPGSLHCPNDGERLVKASSSSGAIRTATGMFCPTCNKTYDPGMRVCPMHGTPLVPPGVAHASQSGGGSAAVSAPAKAQKMCPICGTKYPVTETFCGKDGTMLIRVN